MCFCHVHLEALGSFTQKEKNVCQTAVVRCSLSPAIHFSSFEGHTNALGVLVGVALSFAPERMWQPIHSNVHLSSLGWADKEGFVVLQCLNPEV
jgi:hypothetical protein